SKIASSSAVLSADAPRSNSRSRGRSVLGISRIVNDEDVTAPDIRGSMMEGCKVPNDRNFDAPIHCVPHPQRDHRIPVTFSYHLLSRAFEFQYLGPAPLSR